jgi:hypothetical protein
MTILCRRHQWGAALFVYMVDVFAPGQKALNFTGLAIKACLDQGIAHRSHAPPTLTAATGLSSRLVFTTLATASPLARLYLQSGRD